jgi:hypothetical protein
MVIIWLLERLVYLANVAFIARSRNRSNLNLLIGWPSAENIRLECQTAKSGVCSKGAQVRHSISCILVRYATFGLRWVPA